jgi:hypothetical protein
MPDSGIITRAGGIVTVDGGIRTGPSGSGCCCGNCGVPFPCSSCRSGADFAPQYLLCTISSVTLAGTTTCIADAGGAAKSAKISAWNAGTINGTYVLPYRGKTVLPGYCVYQTFLGTYDIRQFTTASNCTGASTASNGWVVWIGVCAKPVGNSGSQAPPTFTPVTVSIWAEPSTVTTVPAFNAGDTDNHSSIFRANFGTSSASNCAAAQTCSSVNSAYYYKATGALGVGPQFIIGQGGGAVVSVCTGAPMAVTNCSAACTETNVLVTTAGFTGAWTWANFSNRAFAGFPAGTCTRVNTASTFTFTMNRDGGNFWTWTIDNSATGTSVVFEGYGDCPLTSGWKISAATLAAAGADAAGAYCWLQRSSYP